MNDGNSSLQARPPPSRHEGRHARQQIADFCEDADTKPARPPIWVRAGG